MIAAVTIETLFQQSAIILPVIKYAASKIDIQYTVKHVIGNLAFIVIFRYNVACKNWVYRRPP